MIENSRLSEVEIKATRAALRMAMKAAGVEPDAGYDWLSRRWPPVVRYYPHIDLAAVCGGSGLARRD